MRRFALALGLAFILGGCQHHSTGASAPRRVVVVAPQRTDMVRSISLPGDLIGFNETALHAKVSGYLRRIDVDKGDRVRKGQVLAVLEVPELAQQLARARAEHTVKQLTARRVARVWHEDRRLIAREDVDVAAGALHAATAEVERLEALLAYTNIVAPFDGVVTARYVDPGALMPAVGQIGTVLSGGSAVAHGPAPVVTVADIDRLRVYIYVPEPDAGAIAVGQPATLRLTQLPGRPFHGGVTRFAKALDLSTRTMLTEVDLPNPDHALYPGMSADVTIDLERHPAALTVPVTAVGQAPNGAYVFTVRDGRLVQQPVHTGLRDEGAIEITGGLSDGDQIVRYLSGQLTAGAAVEAVVGDASPTPAQ